MNSNRKSFDAIITLCNKGIIQGYDDGTFRPESNVTRGQAAAIVNRVLNNQPANLSPLEMFQNLSICY